VTFDEKTLALFLRTIHPTDTRWCELRALPSRARTFVPVGDVDGVAAFCIDHLDENVYVGVATRRTTENGTAANCAELWTGFVDLDFKSVDETTAREHLARFPLPPSIVVASGYGLHLY
jgi:hypothetical protein